MSRLLQFYDAAASSSMMKIRFSVSHRCYQPAIKHFTFSPRSYHHSPSCGFSLLSRYFRCCCRRATHGDGAFRSLQLLDGRVLITSPVTSRQHRGSEDFLATPATLLHAIAADTLLLCAHVTTAREHSLISHAGQYAKCPKSMLRIAFCRRIYSHMFIRDRFASASACADAAMKLRA